MKKGLLMLSAVFSMAVLHADTYVCRTPGLAESLVTGVGAVCLGVAEFARGVVCGSTTAVTVNNPSVMVTAVTAPAVTAPVVVTPAVYACPGYGQYGRYYYHYRPGYPVYRPGFPAYPCYRY